MTLDLLRFALLGALGWIHLFNAHWMTRANNRSKFLHGLPLLPVFAGGCAAAASLLPAGVVAPLGQGLVVVVIVLETMRILRRQAWLVATGSHVLPVPGFGGWPDTTHALEVRSYRFSETPRELHNLVVVLVTDLHADGRPEPAWYDRMWSTVRGLGPHLLLLGGDFVSHRTSLPILDRCLDGVRDIHPALGKWAVLGNHDVVAPEEVTTLLHGAGVVRLGDQVAHLARADGHSVTLAGYEAPWFGTHAPTGWPVEGVHLALTHTPDNAPALSRAGARWILSGHLHGGQVALPLVGPLFQPSRWSRRWTTGIFPVGHSHLVVSAGVGVAGVPLRLMSPPEIVVLRFHP